MMYRKLKNSDQIVLMRMLICVFHVHTCRKVPFPMYNDLVYQSMKQANIAMENGAL